MRVRGASGRRDRLILALAGSEWAAYITPSILLREGKIAEAREAVKRMPSARYNRDLLESCLQLRPAADLDRMAQEAESSVPTEPDPETWYYQGTIFAFCGKKQYQQQKPVLMGEFSANEGDYPLISDAATALQNWQIQSCPYSFKGWLLWAWDTEEAEQQPLNSPPYWWSAVSGDGSINTALAPSVRPDPCQ